MDHATRHCGDGVGGSERRNIGQIDVDVLVPEGRSEKKKKKERRDVVLPGSAAVLVPEDVNQSIN